MREYDFRRPTKLSRDHVRVLQIALEAFARGVSSTLTAALRNGVRMDLDGIEQFSYDEYISSLDNPVFLSLFTIEPLPGRAALAMPLDSAMASIDHLVGGPGAQQQPSRAMTSMETILMRSLLDRIMTELSAALGPLAAVTPEVNAVEYNPALAQVTGASETVIIGRFSLTLPSRKCEVTLCLPFSAFAASLDKAGAPTLSAREQAERAAASAAMTRRLEHVPVEVAVRLSPTQMRADALLGLTPGEIIPLGHQRAVPLEVTAADVTFARAIPWQHRSRLAAQITATTHTPTTKDSH